MSKCPIDGTPLGNDSVKLKDDEICGQCAAQVGLIPGSTFTHNHAPQYSIDDIKGLMSTNSKVTDQAKIDFQKKEVAAFGIPTTTTQTNENLDRKRHNPHWIMLSAVGVLVLALAVGIPIFHAHQSDKSASGTSSATSERIESSSNVKEADSASSQHIQSSRYQTISLAKFTENTDKFVGKDIQVRGTVAYIQKNPDDSTMYYAVIIPQDEYDSTGDSTGHGTVAEIDADIMKKNSIHEGDTITVRGGGLQDTVKLNGKTLNSDIIVDGVSK